MQKKSVDMTLLITTAVLVIFGLVMVYDASVVQGFKDFNDNNYYIRQQLIWVALSLVVGVFFTKLDYHFLKQIATPVLIGSLLLLVAVFIPGLGVSGGGAHRWLNFGFFTVQPAEIIKLTGAIFLASIFEKKASWKLFLLLLTVVVFITAVLQKDLGSTIVFTLMSGVMYFASGGPIWQILAIIPVVLVAFLGLVLTSAYRIKRILAYLDPFSDTQGFTYHISQVLIALGSGGLFGLGLGQSRQKFEYIPEVATDSIFAIVGEELGFVGAIVLLGLFLLLILRGLKIARETNDPFGQILAVGLISWLGLQVIINLSSMVALLPLTGVPLPFVSYGGSALLVNIAAIGILLNISKEST
ncbi:MAG: putative lipid II flippase FtsW [Candidatus Daviesbacteria bacterium]|nr:putative lipid II flippase FtsW [Candidatus Daviesbacteria bacterium]